MKKWQSKLRKNYTSLEEWKNYSSIYGLATRLGYASAEEAWEANPMIQGSVNPKDFSVIPDKLEEPSIAKPSRMRPSKTSRCFTNTTHENIN